MLRTVIIAPFSAGPPRLRQAIDRFRRWRRDAELMYASTCVQSLAAIFLMNNVNFIVKSIQGSTELGGLGADWVDVNRPLVSPLLCWLILLQETSCLCPAPHACSLFSI